MYWNLIPTMINSCGNCLLNINGTIFKNMVWILFKQHEDFKLKTQNQTCTYRSKIFLSIPTSATMQSSFSHHPAISRAGKSEKSDFYVDITGSVLTVAISATFTWRTLNHNKPIASKYFPLQSTGVNKAKHLMINFQASVNNTLQKMARTRDGMMHGGIDRPLKSQDLV